MPQTTKWREKWAIHCATLASSPIVVGCTVRSIVGTAINAWLRHFNVVATKIDESPARVSPIVCTNRTDVSEEPWLGGAVTLERALGLNQREPISSAH
jgi:hypothetical protein